MSAAARRVTAGARIPQLLDTIMATPSETERVEEEEAAEPPSLDKLAPEILNIIVDAIAAAEDVLQPRHLACLARSCKVMNAAVKDAKIS